MKKLNGVDVSGWQPSNVLDLIDFDFAIVKITQGNSLTNKNLDGQLKSAKAKGDFFSSFIDYIMNLGFMNMVKAV